MVKINYFHASAIEIGAKICDIFRENTHRVYWRTNIGSATGEACFDCFVAIFHGAITDANAFQYAR